MKSNRMRFKLLLIAVVLFSLFLASCSSEKAYKSAYEAGYEAAKMELEENYDNYFDKGYKEGFDEGYDAACNDYNFEERWVVVHCPICGYDLDVYKPDGSVEDYWKH